MKTNKVLGICKFNINNYNQTKILNILLNKSNDKFNTKFIKEQSVIFSHYNFYEINKINNNYIIDFITLTSKNKSINLKNQSIIMTQIGKIYDYSKNKEIIQYVPQAKLRILLNETQYYTLKEYNFFTDLTQNNNTISLLGGIEHIEDLKQQVLTNWDNISLLNYSEVALDSLNKFENLISLKLKHDTLNLDIKPKDEI